MRIRLILALVVGLLFCTLSTLEFPELVNLTDDTSNDFSLAVFQTNDSRAVQRQARDLPQGTRVKISGNRRQVAALLVDTKPYAIPEVLLLLCTLRT